MLSTSKAETIRGTVRVPGDKSISHRAVMFSSIAKGTSEIRGFLEAEDCLSTMACFQAMGVEMERSSDLIKVHGRGLRGLKEPGNVLDAGNSGTTMRLISGILAGQNFLSILTGDDSLRSRPMQRIADPLRRMGASIDGRGGGSYAPLVIRGGELQGIRYQLPVASAQVKSAVLLAGLYADGDTVVAGDDGSRDHTENMLEAFGAEVGRGEMGIYAKAAELHGQSIEVPGDISSAAFFLAAAAASPGSEVTVEGVGLNPTRTGILDVLKSMGAEVTAANVRNSGGEPIGDITVRGTQLRGVTVNGSLIPRLIDEIPVIAVIASQAEGTTVIGDAEELKVKESNRIAAMVTELQKLGVDITERPDGMEIQGRSPLQGGLVESSGDHRIAMSLAVAGLFSEEPVMVHNSRCIDVSFPSFAEILGTISGGRVHG